MAGAAPAPGQGRAFSIDRFAVSITVRPDASLDVREAITFDFRGGHQAVYRVIPVRYPRGGFEFALRLDGVQVLDEQFRPLKTNVSYSGRYVRIKASVPGAVNTTKTVTVVYRVRRGLFNVDDHEELYWNVTGRRVGRAHPPGRGGGRRPAGGGPRDARAIAYTGSRGIAGTDYVEQRDGNVLTFRTTRPLRPREGLTIAVAWPPGVVGRPTRLALRRLVPPGQLAARLALPGPRPGSVRVAVLRARSRQPPLDQARVRAAGRPGSGGGRRARERARASERRRRHDRGPGGARLHADRARHAGGRRARFPVSPPQAHPGRSRHPAVRVVRARQALRHGLCA